MEEDTELIILVNLERVMWEKLSREASESLVKIGVDLSFLGERILLKNSVSRNSFKLIARLF